MRNLILLLLVSTVFACSNDDENLFDFLDCTEHTENYEKYSGEEIDCQFHYYLTEYKGQQYIELQANCADLTRFFVINEDCVDICKNEPYEENSECGQYLSGREKIEILLIKK